MSRRKLYLYNPTTDNFERYYPTLGQRLWRWILFGIASILSGGAIYLIAFYALSAPTERNLRQENAQLKARYKVLQHRLDGALQVMGDLASRDANFYRVVMGLEPVSDARRFAGLDNDARYKELRSLGDASLALQLSQGMDLLERQIYTQSLSFDQLREAASEQRERFDHIPAILPVSPEGMSLAGGYGYRRDALTGIPRFHEGLDFAAPVGTPVYATADGIVSSADRKSGLGNAIEIDHGFNYTTLYAHLSRIDVSPGQRVSRGDVIGRVGSSGRSSAPHLHYEVHHRGDPDNPVHYCYMDMDAAAYESLIELAENAGHVMD